MPWFRRFGDECHDVTVTATVCPESQDVIDVSVTEDATGDEVEIDVREHDVLRVKLLETYSELWCTP